MHTIQVEATDSLGQVVDSEPSTLKVDRKPPRVSVRVRGGAVTVRVSDGPKKESSGVAAGSVHVSFGDGHSAQGRAKVTHRYKSGGSYTVTVTASDNAGNQRHRASAGVGFMRRRRLARRLSRSVRHVAGSPRRSWRCSARCLSSPLRRMRSTGPPRAGSAPKSSPSTTPPTNRGMRRRQMRRSRRTGSTSCSRRAPRTSSKTTVNRSEWRSRTARHPARRRHLPLRPRHRGTGACRRRKPRCAHAKATRSRQGDRPRRRRTPRSAPMDATSLSPVPSSSFPRTPTENVDVYVRDMDVQLTADRKRLVAPTRSSRPERRRRAARLR